MIKIFDTLEKYNVYTNNGQNLESGNLYFVKEDNSTHYYTNNIDGVATIYDSVETPSGNIEITENAESLDIAEYASATVNVPIPEGYIIPSGNKSITANGENIDVNNYATATVNVPIPQGYILPTGNKEITANGTGIDVAQYATASVAVPQPSGNITLTENGENINIAQYATATVNVPTSGGGDETLRDLIERDITSITIPSGTTTIGANAFNNCTSLTSVTIPNSVTEISSSAFAGCLSLTTFNSNTIGKCIIPNGITQIPMICFRQCAFTEVIIPSGVISIGANAFNNCSSLTSVTILATTPPTLGNVNALAGTNANLVIYVPSESVETYKAASSWSTYASIIQAIQTT